MPNDVISLIISFQKQSGVKKFNSTIKSFE